MPLQNNSEQDLTGPVLLSGSVHSDGRTITLVYDETLAALDESHHFDHFTVNAGGTDIPIDYGISNNDSITLDLAEPGIIEEQNVTVTYVDSTGTHDDAVQDIYGNGADSQTLQLVNNSTLDRTSPVIKSGKVEESGLRITLLYDEVLAQQPTAEPSDFVLYLGTDEIPFYDRINEVSTHGDEVHIGLTERIGIDEVVKLSYQGPSDGDHTTISDQSGNDAASFAHQVLENTSTQDLHHRISSLQRPPMMEPK